jgi:hypothetical protein
VESQFQGTEVKITAARNAKRISQDMGLGVAELGKEVAKPQPGSTTHGPRASAFFRKADAKRT